MITIRNSASTIPSDSQIIESERVSRATRQEASIRGMWTYWPRNLERPSFVAISSPATPMRNSSTRRNEMQASTRPTRSTDQNAARTMNAASAAQAPASRPSGRPGLAATHTARAATDPA